MTPLRRQCPTSPRPIIEFRVWTSFACRFVPLLSSIRQGGEGGSDPIESDCFCSYRFQLRLHLGEGAKYGWTLIAMRRANWETNSFRFLWTISISCLFLYIYMRALVYICSLIKQSRMVVIIIDYGYIGANFSTRVQRSVFKNRA